MGILVPNLIACENDHETYKRQIEDSLNSFQRFENQLFQRADFGINCRIERANTLLKRLEDLKTKMNGIDSNTTLYFPSKLISLNETKFKILNDDFLKKYQQNDAIENILDIEYEKLLLLKDDAQSLRFSEIPERVNANSFRFMDFKSKDRINLEAIKHSSAIHAQEENQNSDVLTTLSESSSSSSGSMISQDLTDQESSDDDVSPMSPQIPTQVIPSDVPDAPPAPPLPPLGSNPEISPNDESKGSVLKKPQAGRANLLASIREGTKLKRVKSSEKKKPVDSDLMSTLAAKLQTRRNKIVPTDESNSRPTSSSYNSTDDESWA